MSSLTNEGLFLFLYTARAVHEPVRANGAWLGAKRREREPSMSPSGRMEHGLEQREEGASRFRFILEEPIVLWYNLFSSSAR